MSKIYDAQSIVVLGIMEGIRKKPEMFIGSVSDEGLCNLVWEIIDNSVNEALEGFCDTIKIRLLKDNIIEVSDNGRGIPADFYEKAGKSKLEVILTGKYIRGELTGGIYKLSRKNYKGGLVSVNGLSETLEASVIKDGKVLYQKYHKGVLSEEIKKTVEKSEYANGTLIRFRADREIFGELEHDYEILLAKLKEIKGIKIIFSDERNETAGRTESFYFDGEIKEFLKWKSEKIQSLNIFKFLHVNISKDFKINGLIKSRKHDKI